MRLASVLAVTAFVACALSGSFAAAEEAAQVRVRIVSHESKHVAVTKVKHVAVVPKVPVAVARHEASPKHHALAAKANAKPTKTHNGVVDDGIDDGSDEGSGDDNDEGSGEGSGADDVDTSHAAPGTNPNATESAVWESSGSSDGSDSDGSEGDDDDDDDETSKTNVKAAGPSKLLALTKLHAVKAAHESKMATHETKKTAAHETKKASAHEVKKALTNEIKKAVAHETKKAAPKQAAHETKKDAAARVPKKAVAAHGATTTTKAHHA